MNLDSSKNSLRRKGMAMLTFLLALTTPVPSHAWGHKGHRIIVEIAEDHLTPEARKALRKLMGSDDIVQYATWADGVRHQRPETVPWHYVNIPGDSSGYDAHRDCPERDCIVAKIEKCSVILRDQRQSSYDRQEAVTFLVHLIGDIHQPMHAIGDGRGGNDVPDIEFGNALCGFRPCELHSTWDSGLIRHTRFTEQQYVHRLEATIITDHLQASGDPEQWANESFRDAQAAWVDPDTDIDENYFRRELPVLNERLALAGLRLAALLNDDLGRK
jgi:hypothetical protein